MERTSVSVRDGSLTFKVKGTKFVEFTPLFAVKGKLAPIKKLRMKEQGEGLKFTGEVEGISCNIVLMKTSRDNVDVLVFKAQCDDGFTNDGIICAFTSSGICNFDRMLAYHFTYTPPKYFGGKVDEPFDYPAVVEKLDEVRYDPWSYPWHAKKISEFPYHLKVSQVLFKLKDGTYVFLLPLTNSGCRGYISHFKDNQFDILLNSYCKMAWKNAFILAIGVGNDPYVVIEKTYDVAFERLGRSLCLRKNKKYPDELEYLGWCSWNAYWREISEDKIIYAYNRFKKLNLPIRMFLIDDGWIDSSDERIRRFEADSNKFPHGFKHLVARLKERAVYVGLWHALNGYWNGIDPESELGKTYKAYLMESADGKLVPDPTDMKALKFYLDWYGFISRCGFDFIKVDNQSFMTYSYRGKIPCEEAARRIEEAIQMAASLNGLNILNCMAQIPEAYFNWYVSNVARACVDYIVPHKRSRDKLHIYFCVYNALWLSQVAYPDYDMFQTHDPLAVQQAVARAVSGGPVYVTDEPDKTRPEIIKKLALSNGKLPRPDIPALPTEDVLMRDPYNEHVALKAFTHAKVAGVGTYGIIAAFNITKDNVAVDVSISPSDARLKEEKYVVYEYFSEKYYLVERSESISLTLDPLETKLFIIAPLQKWIVPIGLNDIFIMPKGMEYAMLFDDEAIVKLRDVGTLLAYTEEEVHVEGGDVVSYKPLLKVKCRNDTIRIKRRA
ncbi:MAG: hypothetical protein DRZ82_00805 [Thermoprotei archaeon]|nr:MAG: hypothetical protein DRZ82_00805 [Thermoprotei archaeon]